ncbi:Hypothetical protein A7982_04284 [Minicystis rosea]|nr:Hypothetical protein A7982_04284 [Minicystis rosea]
MRAVNVPLTTPLACVALAAAIPLVPAAGAWLVARAGVGRDTRAILAPGAGVSLWLVAVIAMARAAHHFVTGLVVGTVAVAALGAWQARAWIRDGFAAGARRRSNLLVAAIALVAVVPAVRCYFHDELTIGGHLSIVAQLENGAFPPRLATFPQFELDYHDGFDVIAAAFGVVLRVPAALAIDLTTLLAVAYTFFLGAHLGRVLGGARTGALTGLLALFGGGVHLLCPKPGAPLGHHLIGYCEIDHVWINPPLGSYFFQHPFGAGIPLFLAVLVLLAERRSVAHPGRYALFAVLLAALSQSQTVLFACALPSFVVAESVRRAKLDPRRAAGAVAAGVASVALARVLGGFFAATPYREGSGLELHLGIGSSLAGTLLWNARTYGVLLPLGLAGLYFARRERLFLALVIGGSVLVPNALRFRYSWDIVKFATVAELALALCTGVVLTRIGEARSASRAGRGIVVALLAGAAMGWSATFHAAAWLAVPQTSFDHRPDAIDEVDAAVIGYLRHAVRPEEGVYRALGKAKAYDQWGGLSTPWPEEMAAGFGVAPRLLKSRQQLLKVLPASAAEWAREGIVWLVLDKVDKREQRLRAHADKWVRDGEADVALERGSLRVVHLHAKR